MFYCQSITVAGQRSRKASSLLGQCQDITRTVQSDTVRAASRYDCCGVQKATKEGTGSAQRLPRPKPSDASSDYSAFETGRLPRHR